MGDSQGGRTEVVIALCKNAVRQGVPAPKFAGSIPSQISAAELERLATAAGLDRDASHEQYGQAVDKVECRYLGVLKDDGSTDPSAEATPQSQLAFEFLFHGGGGIQVHPIKVKCAKVIKGAGLVPPRRRNATPAKAIQARAEAGATAQLGVLAKKLKVKDGDLFVSCSYVGIRRGSDQPDVRRPAFDDETLEFQWVLRTGDWEWTDSVTMWCKHLRQGVPLPRCSVTKQRLTDVAGASAQKFSMDDCFDVVCRYESSPPSGSAGATAKSSDRISIRDLVKFHWEVRWAGGQQLATTEVRAGHALEDKRLVPLPAGWATALRALGAFKDARVISNAELLAGIMV